MAHSIEGRVPFLDHRFAELAASLSVRAKIHNGWSKFVLRKAMTGLLPADVQWRPGKMGYPTPYRPWLSGPLFKETRARILEGAFARAGYLNRPEMERRLAEQREGTAAHTALIWKCLCLATWYDQRDSLADQKAAVRANCDSAESPL